MFTRRIIFSILIFFPALSFGDSMTLSDVLQYVLTNHPAIKASEYNSQILKRNQDASRGTSDWNLSSRLSHSEIRYDDNGDNFVYSSQESNRQYANVSLNKNIWSFGGTVSMYYIMNRRESSFSGSVDSLPADYYSSLDLSLFIPLLNNAGGKLSRFQYEQFDYRIDASHLQEDERKELILADISHDYINWSTAIESSKVAKDYQNLTETLQHLVTEMAGSPTVSQRNSYRVDWVIAEAAREFSLRKSKQVASLIQLAEFTKIERAKFMDEPSIALYSTKNWSTVSATQPTELETLRAIKSLKITDDRLNHEIIANKNDTRPDLDLVIGTHISGSGEHYQSSQDDDMTSRDIGLNFRYPIGNTLARANLSQSHIKQLENQDNLRNLTLKMNADITSLEGQMNELVQTVILAEQQVKLADQGINMELEAFKSGVIDISVLINAMQVAYEQKQRYIEQASLFQHLWIEYLSLTDKLWHNGAITTSL